MTTKRFRAGVAVPPDKGRRPWEYPRLRRGSQGARLLRVLVMGWPGYVGGPYEFGNDFHKAASRMGDQLKPRGFTTVSRKRTRESWQEYRFLDDFTYWMAAAQVRSWDTGEDVEVLDAEVRKRIIAAITGGGSQTSLGV